MIAVMILGTIGIVPPSGHTLPAHPVSLQVGISQKLQLVHAYICRLLLSYASHACFS